MYVKEQAKIAGCSTAWIIWIAVIMAALGIAGALLYGVQQNIIRYQQVRTTGYVQAQVDQMSKDLTAFDKNNVELAKAKGNPDLIQALDAQQMGIVQDMWSAYDSIPQDAKDSVPNDLIQFIQSHGRSWQP